MVRRDKIELVRLSSVRFENLFKFDSFTVHEAKIDNPLLVTYRWYNRTRKINWVNEMSA